jgi:arylsulfatase A-like enzyme
MHHRTARPRLRAGLVAVLTAAAAATAALAGSGPVAAAPPPATAPMAAVPFDGRPNIVLILTDDQRDGTYRTMPNVNALLRARGTTYRRAMVPTSLCCPSRATILTGLYAHSSRLFGNGDVGGARYGGWRRFHRLGLENRTLGKALHDAGYRTALIGKYLNFFGKYSPDGYVPPGWDTFSTFLSSHGSYYSYRLSDGGQYGTEPQDYSTDVLAAKATEFITTTPLTQPLFLYFAPFGPHAPYKPAPRHLGALDGKLEPYTAPTLHQRLRTMPRWMRERKHFTQAEVDLTRQRQLEALMSVDDAVGSIVRAMEATGRVGDTLFLFMSDNGYFWGEHRIIGKDSPYKDSTAIPMVARWDGHTEPGSSSTRLVLNVDVARTLTRAAGVRMRTDGLDMFGDRTRGGLVLEAMDGYNSRPAYCGWRTRHRMYVHWDSGEEELFDYRTDPDERHNLAHLKRWRPVRDALRAKAMATCRPRPPHFRWSPAPGPTGVPRPGPDSTRP